MEDSSPATGSEHVGPEWLDSAAGRDEFLRMSAHELLHPFGEGSYGKVWLARSATGAFRAIKVVFRRRFKNQTPYDREFRGILKFEPVSRLHEGFVDILHVARDDAAGFFYYIMELGDDRRRGQQIDPRHYEPKTLASEVQQRGRLPLEQCLQLGISLANALGNLHEQGLVHRDIKPANVIFVGGVPKLADIGLVTDAGADVSFVGTEGYIPREGPGSPAADIYSLGKVLYEISTGRDRKDFPEVPGEVIAQDSRWREFLELNEVLLRACAEDVDQRYHRAQELHAHLALLQAGKSVKGLIKLERAAAALRKYWTAAAAVLALALLAFFLGFLEIKREGEDRQRRAGSYVGYGTRLLQEGDLAGALPWFVSGWQLDRREAVSDATHRLRLTATLRETPRLVQMWFRPHYLGYGEFGKDGNTVLIPGPDGRAGIYEVRGGGLISPLLGVTNEIQRAVWNRSFTQVATSYGDGGTCIYDPVSGQNVVHLHGGDWHIFACFDPSGERVLTCGADGVARIWDVRSGQETRLLRRPSQALWHGAWSPDGTRVVTSSQDGAVVVWNVEAGRELLVFTNHAAWAHHAVFSADGRFVASSGADGKARLWEAGSGREVIHPLEHRREVNSVEFSHDGRYLVTAGWDGTARLWDRATGHPAFTILRHGGQTRVMHACFSPDDRWVLTVTYHGVVRVWELPPPIQAKPIVFCRSGRLLAHWNGALVEVSQAVDGVRLGTLRLPHPADRAPVLSRDGHVLVASWRVPESPNRAFRAWRTADRTVMGPDAAYDAKLSRWVLDDQGSRLAVYSSSRVVVVDLRTAKPLFDLPFETGTVSAVTFDHAGNRLAIGFDRWVQFYAVTDGTPLLPSPLSHPQEVSHLEFGPRDERIVSAWKNQMLDMAAAQIWDTRTGQPVGPPLSHNDGVSFATFSRDGSLVATCSEDGAVRLWEGDSGRPRPIEAMEHDQAVTMAAFSRNSRWLATAAGGKVRVWDTVTGQPLTPWWHHDDAASRLVFAANDTLLAVQGSGGQSWVHSLADLRLDDPELALTAQIRSAQPLPAIRNSVSQTNDVVRESWEQRLRLRSRKSSDGGN